MKPEAPVEKNTKTSVEETIQTLSPAVKIDMPQMEGHKDQDVGPQVTKPIPRLGEAVEMPQMGGDDYSHLAPKYPKMLPPPRVDQPLNLPKSDKDEFKGLGDF